MAAQASHPGLEEFLRSSPAHRQADAAPGVKRGQNAPSAEKEQKPQVPGSGAACQPKPEYNEFIEKAARNSYDPQRLGDRSQLKNRFNCDIHNFDDVLKYTNQALRETVDDPYSYAMSAKSFKMRSQDYFGVIGGIGIELRQYKLTDDRKPIADEYIAPDRDPGPEPARAYDAPNVEDQSGTRGTTVYRVIKGTPAERAGLQNNDVISQVDGKDILNTPVDDVVAMIRGTAGKPIHLGLIRDGVPIERDLTRDAIKLQTVFGPQDKGDGIYYIRVSAFNSQTAKDFKKAMEQSADAKAFVIDMRNSSGGLVEEALQSAEMFIQSGVILRIKERVESDPDHPQYSIDERSVTEHNTIHKTFNSDGVETDKIADARFPYLLAGRPIVILTNRLTASASEMFTGAVHDTAHATTVGDQTFGKGIGQRSFPDMPQGTAINLTTLHYETPSGNWPGDAHNNRHPLLPDKTIVNPKGVLFGSSEDLQYQEAAKIAREKIAPAQSR